MDYDLGIDLGTTFTAAAIARAGQVRVCELGNRASVVPSVVLIREDEEVLTGEAAERRAINEPERVAREFKRRLGDPTPLLLGGRPYSAEQLQARLLRAVLAHIATREDGPPRRVAVTRPANWGPYKLDLFTQALRLAGIDDALVLTEPEAAAIHYASQERLGSGAVIGVYDLGGGTFDAAVLRKTDDGFAILGRPEGIDRLGGIDFDEAVFAHVARALGGALDELDPDDAAAAASVARLRQECVAAKESLSADTEVSIPVALPNVQTEVRMTRSELEALIRSPLTDSIEVLRLALRSAEVQAEDLDAVLLVGGSSRIPLVAQLVTAELGRPVAVDAHPKHGIAMGAALAAAEAAGAAPSRSGAAPGSVAPVPPVTVPQPPSTPAAAAASVPAPPMASPQPVAPPTASPPTASPPTASASESSPEPRRRRTGLLVGIGVVAVVALVGLGVVLLGGGGGTSPVEAAVGGVSTVSLDSVQVQDQRYVVDFTPRGFDPSLGDDPQRERLHVFWDVWEPSTVGMQEPAATRGSWLPYATASDGSFRIVSDAFAVGQAPPGAGAICAVVADGRGWVLEPDRADELASCVSLP